MTAQIQSATKAQLKSPQANKNGKCILVSDLIMFVAKYKKERSWFQPNKDLPPEIYLMDLIANKYGTSVSRYTSISDEDRKTIHRNFEVETMVKGLVGGEARAEQPRLR